MRFIFVLFIVEHLPLKMGRNICTLFLFYLSLSGNLRNVKVKELKELIVGNVTFVIYSCLDEHLLTGHVLMFHFHPHRSAGTVGAVVTCPLEVVKTRLQSSTAFMTPSRLAENAGGGPANGGQSELLRPEQRRKLSTTILRNRSQPQVIGGVRRVVPTSFTYSLIAHLTHRHCILTS